MKFQKELDFITEKLEILSNYNYSSSIIYWDLETKMPKKALDKPSKVLGFYSGESHKILTDTEFNKNLEVLLDNIELLDPINQKIMSELKKDIENIKRIPLDEYTAYTELLSKSQSIWAEARKENDFNKFLPYLEKIIAYKKKYAEYKGYKEHPYDALLDDYEPGMTVKSLDAFFKNLKEQLVPLISKIKEKKDFISDEIVKRPFSIEAQKKYANYIAEYLGFDFDRGILDESSHPFSMGLNKYDVRMTTRYALEDVQSSIFGTLHETGHSLYEQNIGEDIYNTVLGGGNSMGIHESQSRLYENLVGRSISFWKPIYKNLQEVFSPSLDDVTIEDFHKAINKVEPSLIRVEADELTYSLHIMIRYEIEKGLVEGKIEIKDLPEIWNKYMNDYLGITPPTDADGVLQDVHWAAGLFGYFPSYALGSANASQIMNTMEKEVDVKKALESSDLEVIKLFLEEKIHKYGKLKDPKEIMVIATNEEPNSKYYVDYLTDKYSTLYELD